MKRKILSLSVIAVLALTACNKNISPQKPGELPNTVVLHWNEVAYQAFGGTAYQHSLMASRINAMVHLAIHDALNGIEEKYNRYAYSGKDPDADPVVSASYAAYAVLLHQIPGKKNYLDSALSTALENTDLESDAAIRGAQFGKEAAAAVIQKRFQDGCEGNVVGIIPPSEEPGVYQAVPPFDFVFAPFWENVKPFALQKKLQFRCEPPPPLNSQAYADAFNEVKMSGIKENSNRTSDQTAYSKYWYEFSEAGWNRVAASAIADRNLNLLETARLFALVDVAMADAYIAGWDSKMYFNLWRPYTAIRKADIDGNPSTEKQTDWEPLENTPPVQDYPSTHSALGNAAAKVLERLLGNEVEFTMTSPTGLPGYQTRSFTSFKQAANENADSRVKAGIHFRFACDAGQKLGDQVGNWAVDNLLTPIQ